MAVLSSTIRQARTSGELVLIEIKPGVCIKLYKEEAIERGLWPPKAEKPTENKRRSGAANKARSTE